MRELVNRTFLFEIGVEDLPPGFVSYARDRMQNVVPALFSERRVEFSGLSVYCSPRRLAFLIDECATMQADAEHEAKGPAVRVAYDADGNPTKAAIGFARSQGVPVESLQVVEAPKGQYVSARKVLKGKPTIEIIPEIASALIESFSFVKMMRWTQERFSFVRPVRWLVALLGDEIAKCSAFGVESSNKSWGTWTQGESPIEISDGGTYLKTMAEHGIIPDQGRRREMIAEGINTVEEKLGCQVVCDDEMISVLADSLDSPRVLCGDFDRKFLQLPEPVLITSMWHHQYFLATRPRYFSKPSGGFAARDASLTLLPHFVAMLANPEAKEEIVRGGSEAVLMARLEDAAFFYSEDQKTPLDKLLPKLRGMVFHKGLGDLFMKSQRLANLAPELATLVFDGQEAVDGEPVERIRENCRRAGELCKTGLLTHMVGEFPELQGVMGGIYAKLFGDSDSVGDAISEHYRPRGVNDKPPETHCGRVLAISDKLDSICAFFGSGLFPIGSEDPLGLRRDAQGIVSILLDCGYRLGLYSAISQSIELIANEGLIRPADGLKEQVLTFIKQRLSFGLVNGDAIRQDLAAAVISHPCDDIVDLRDRALALQEFSKDEQFEALTTGMKRASNILKGQKVGEFDASLLPDEQEQRLFSEMEQVEPAVSRLTAESKYLDAFRLIASLRPLIDDFFEHVMVMTDDEALRENRLALLGRLTSMFGSIANFSRIVVGK